MTDRPSAATPEEVRLLANFLDDLDSSGHTAEVLAQGDRSPFSESELLDLVRRAQAAQREAITGERIAAIVRQLAAAGDAAEERHECDDPAICTFTVPASSWTTRGGVTMSIAAEVDEFADVLAAAIRAGE